MAFLTQLVFRTLMRVATLQIAPQRVVPLSQRTPNTTPSLLLSVPLASGLKSGGVDITWSLDPSHQTYADGQGRDDDGYYRHD